MKKQKQLSYKNIWMNQETLILSVFRAIPPVFRIN